MAHVLIVHESETIRSDLGRALLAEGLTVAEADSATAAVREIWNGNFDAAMVSPQMEKVSGVALDEHLHHLAPEIVTVAIVREPASRLARKLIELLEGGAVAA
jgi:DNA-binding NtrC family response regulator